MVAGTLISAPSAGVESRCRPLAELDQRMRLRTNACEAGAGGRIGAALSLPWWPENLYAFSQERFLWIHGPRQPSFVDHLLREQGVGSSNLPAPTNHFNFIWNPPWLAWAETWADLHLPRGV